MKKPTPANRSAPRRSRLVLAVAAAAGPAGALPAAAQLPEPPSGMRPTALFVQASHSTASNGIELGARWTWRWRRPLGASGLLTGYTEATLGHWWIRRGADTASNSATRLGVTPIIRWQPGGERGLFLEAGIGANLIAPTYTTASKRFSTVFNFGDHIGIGWRTGGARPWEWTLRLQHFSNADLRRPNPGEDFVQLRVAASF